MASILAMAPTTIYFERTIDSSHVLEGHPGKCGRLHGHTYRFEVWMTAPELGDDGMVVDFFDLKAQIDAWDHVHLNDVVDFRPTAEALAGEMHRRLRALLTARFPDRESETSCRLRLWETPTSYAEIEGHP